MSSETSTSERARMPTWVPVSAFLGTSIALAVPLITLRRARPSIMKQRLSSTAPPQRRSTGTAPSIPVSSSSASTSAQTSVVDSTFESATATLGDLRSAMGHMNKSNGMLAAKAFGIATGLVTVGAFASAWAIKTSLGIQDTKEFGHRMKFVVWGLLPSLTKRLHRAPETDEERQLSYELAPPGSHDGWSWEEAEKRLDRAFEQGGFPLWAEVALREAEAEARVERAKRRNHGLDGSGSE